MKVYISNRFRFLLLLLTWFRWDLNWSERTSYLRLKDTQFHPPSLFRVLKPRRPMPCVITVFPFFASYSTCITQKIKMRKHNKSCCHSHYVYMKEFHELIKAWFGWDVRLFLSNTLSLSLTLGITTSVKHQALIWLHRICLTRRFRLNDVKDLSTPCEWGWEKITV